MKFTLDTAQGILIHACQPGQVTLKIPGDNPGAPYRHEHYSSSLLLGLDNRLEDWPVANITELAIEHLAPIWQNTPDIVLLGTGQKLVFPAMDIYQQFVTRGIGLEVMDTAAACRTYNVLLAEDRRVLALLIVD